MNQTDHRWMDGGWMNGGTDAGNWIWMVVGVLVAILLVVVITKLFSKKS